MSPLPESIRSNNVRFILVLKFLSFTVAREYLDTAVLSKQCDQYASLAVYKLIA